MFDSYMRLLRRLFGETGALSAYLMLRRVGFVLIFVLVGGIVAAGIYPFPPRDVPMTHVGYEIARVDRLEVLDGDARFGIVANITMPDNTALRLVATDGPIAQSVTETACVEVQRNPQSGRLHYRLILPAPCAGG